MIKFTHKNVSDVERRIDEKYSSSNHNWKRVYLHKISGWEGLGSEATPLCYSLDHLQYIYIYTFVCSFRVRPQEFMTPTQDLWPCNLKR